jgi:sulfate adenylyltransferase large subunit
MATGASTADLALLLISAADGLTAQTRRHAEIVTLLGVSHLVVAINKMDQVGWSRSRFAAIEAEFRAFARDLQVDDMTFLPLAARNGDNLVCRSARLPWYCGPSLLEFLETVDVSTVRPATFRMPVQCVIRPDSNFRGYGGVVAGGTVFPGTPVRVLPSGQLTHVARVVTQDGDLTCATAGQSVTLTLTDEIDLSRGDVLATADHGLLSSNRLRARLVALGSEPLRPGRSYLLKLGTATVNATLELRLQVIDLATHDFRAAQHLAPNEIGTAVIALDRRIAADRYASCRELGSFILIDRETCDTIGLGIVEAVEPADKRDVVRSIPKLSDLMRATETHGRSIVKAISWRATGSLDTFVLAAVITGSSTLAGGVALAEVLTKTALYYLHERVWALIRWGKR